MHKRKRLAFALCYALPPLLLAAVLLWVFQGKDLYPFGNKTVSWCDMDSQIVPQLCHLKDVLSGKGSLLYSAGNAGGMNFLGVFFYYLSSPFHLLVVFVPKTQMMQFMNVLVLLKLCAAAFTAYVFFRSILPTLHRGIAVALAVFYGGCGYALAYYQIILWLDAVYLFPLLLLGLIKLLSGGKPYAYVGALVAFAYICFYLTFMVALFVLLYAGVWALTTRHPEKREICFRFLLSSALAVLLSAAGIIPLLSAYFSSARELTSLWDSIITSGTTSDINTSFPLVLSTVAVLPFLFYGKMKREELPLYACIIFLLFSVIYEPTNRLWHMGAYMMFPARYAFILCFLPLAAAGMRLSPKEAGFVSVIPLSENSVKGRTPHSAHLCNHSAHLCNHSALLRIKGIFAENRARLILDITVLVGVFAALGALISFSFTQSTEGVGRYDAFVNSLMGSDGSFAAFTRYYSLVLLFVMGVIALYHFKLLKRAALIGVVLSLALTECAFSARIYMGQAAREESIFPAVVALEKTLPEANLSAGQNFYRVKESRYNYLVNYTGAAGHNSLSHYTSMTDAGCMDLMKKLGYESCWMEVAGHTGTVFTDALFSVRYATYYGYDWEREEGYFYLKETPYCLPLGIVTPTDLSRVNGVFNHDRVEYLKQIYAALFPQGEPLITEWETPWCESTGIYPDPSGVGNIYYVTGDNPLYRFSCTVTDKQTLYLDVYDHGILNSTNVWPNDMADVFVNGAAVSDGRNFPSNLHNGFLTLGTFENCTVEVEVRLKKNVYLRNFSVFGISDAVMQSVEASAHSADLALKGNTYFGTVSAKAGDSLFVAAPYLKGFTAKVNGKSVRVSETLEGFISIPLTEGENRVSIKYTPPGLELGLLLSLTTLAGILVAFFLKVRYNRKWMHNLSYYTVVFVSVALFVALFVFPPVVRIILS